MKRKKYTEKFKQDVLTELNNGKKVSQISSEKGITPSTISKWKKAFSSELGYDTKYIKRLESELKECKKVIGELYLERSFLKKVKKNLQNSLTEQKKKELGGYEI